MHRTMHARAALAGFLLSILVIVPVPVAFSQTPEAEQIQQEQPGQRKPIPRGVKIAILASVAILIAVALAFSVRAWRASNLFDREYHFPPVASTAIRLGASRSGGHMATIKFRNRGDPASDAN
jgi:hypothetical protein